MELLHVYDLPQLYTHPSLPSLLSVLDSLKIQPTSFSTEESLDLGPSVHAEGIPRYLTTIISSSLSWLKDDSEREQVWDLASARLSERSGRNAMPSMSRSFHINADLSIELFEPSLTEDNLGLKTWTSSLLLARRLPLLRHHVPEGCDRILELGAGTGLVGIAATILWNVNVLLTDLPEIVPNLRSNVDSNEHLLQNTGREMFVRALDWSDATDVPQKPDERFSLIIAADPIYSIDHPRLLVDAVQRWIEKNQKARFVVELPLRKGYEKERQDLRERLIGIGMQVIEEGTDVGYDDWQGLDGRPAKVECWWSVWHVPLSLPL